MQENNGNNQKQSGLSWSTPASAPAQKPAPVQAPVKTQAPAASPAAVSSSAKYVGMIVIGVIAGVIIAWSWTALRSPAGETATEQGQNATGTDLGVNTATVPALGSNPALTILSPQPAGMSVAVTKAIVSSPTWIVVYESKDGTPGNALGAALFFPEGQTGTVELLRATMPGRTYLAVQQVDNGDRKFSLKDDQFLTEGERCSGVSFETK